MAPPTSSGPAEPRAAVRGRSWARAIGFGLLAGMLVGFALVGMIAAPLYLWAKATEPEVGLQRPLVRSGLRLAPLLGLVAFLLTTVLSTRWRLGDQARRAETE